jgi:hypothetical protein
LKLIFIYGMPATGKLTVARELAAKTGFKLFHNHLVVDLLLSVFEFGSPEFIRLREEIWLSVMKSASASGLPGLIFTFAPERTVRPSFIAELEKTISQAQSSVHYIELVCPLAELKQRMADASRSEFGKLTSIELFERLLADGAFASPQMPPASIRIDTSACSPAEAAEKIVGALNFG